MRTTIIAYNLQIVPNSHFYKLKITSLKGWGSKMRLRKNPQNPRHVVAWQWGSSYKAAQNKGRGGGGFGAFSSD